MYTKNFLLCIALALSACRTVDSVPQNFNLNSGAGTGVLLSSITYHGTYATYSMVFNKLGDNDSQQITIGRSAGLVPPGALDWDIKQRGLRGDVFAVELPAGEYQFYSWRVSSGYTHIKPSVDFHIPFTIQAGKATYLGNFNFNRAAGFAGSVTAVDVAHKNESERDLAIIQKKFSGFSNDNIVVDMHALSSSNLLGGPSSSTTTIPIIIPTR